MRCATNDDDLFARNEYEPLLQNRFILFKTKRNFKLKRWLVDFMRINRPFLPTLPFPNFCTMLSHPDIALSR